MELVPVSQRIVKPSDCVVVLGIPNTRDGFRRAQEQKDASFVNRFLGGWPQYYAQFVRDLEAVEPFLYRLGVTILHDASLGEFAGVLTQPFEVVVLFSHWHEDAVEFSGRLEPTSTILAAISPTYSGILDLCVCHPEPLVRELRIHRPDCLVKYIPDEASPRYWLYFYRILFSQLRSRDLTYLGVIEEVACAMLDWALPKSGGLDAEHAPLST
jgi:hypothetical protein